ncbi:Isochorismatase hydrolase, partial [Sistotremastrum suecicum HHB10207 ss-3]
NMAAAALILVDLQTEFLSPKGNFPIAEQSRTSLQSRLEELVPKWRPRAPIIWVRSEYTPTEELRTSATTSEDEYLSGTHSGPVACCSAGSPGAQFPAEIEELVHPVDEVIVKHWYSAFKSTNLDYDLKQAGVSQIYIAGLLSHICVKATVRDALRRGYQVAVIKDCLGWRNEEVHAQAVARIAEMGAVLIESAGVMQ